MSVQYRWDKDIESMEMDGEWILIHLQKFTFTKLEDLGGFIWSHLREPCTKDQVIELVLETYSISKDQVEQDVQHFLQHLLQLKLLEECPVSHQVS